ARGAGTHAAAAAAAARAPPRLRPRAPGPPRQGRSAARRGGGGRGRAGEREVRRARVEALRAAVAATEECPHSEAAALVRQSYALQLRRAQEELAQEGADATAETAAPVAPTDGRSRRVHAAAGA